MSTYINSSDQLKGELIFNNIKGQIFQDGEDSFFNERQTKMFAVCDCKLSSDKKILKLHLELTDRNPNDLIERYCEQQKTSWTAETVERQQFLAICYGDIRKRVKQYLKHACEIKEHLSFVEKKGVLHQVEFHLYIRFELDPKLALCLQKEIRNGILSIKSDYLKD